jgi:hypothetical protein
MVNRINQPSDNKDRNLVNVPPPELGEEILWVHSARVDEALVTAALYLDARDLKSVRNIQNKRATRPFSAFKGATA